MTVSGLHGLLLPQSSGKNNNNIKSMDKSDRDVGRVRTGLGCEKTTGNRKQCKEYLTLCQGEGEWEKQWL
jgi:hypothetical protein